MTSLVSPDAPAGEGQLVKHGPIGALESALRERRSKGSKLLIGYLTAGMTDDWLEALQALVASGADAVEVGIPFSDPMIDGPIIQHASSVALERGTTPIGVLKDLTRARLGIPVVAMTYYNLVFRMGHKRMARSMVEAGITGAIVPDLPLEEMEEWGTEAADAGLETVLLVAPSTPAQRVSAICAKCHGFVYAVARMGVTGERANLASGTSELTDRIRAATDIPVCVGIGISTPDQAAEATKTSDGVVVGSALVRRLFDGGPQAVGEFAGKIRSALDGR